MKLVIGLGNPGGKYERTRHNVGFEVIAELARRHGGSATQTKFQALVDDVVAGGERLLLVRPQTYMNRSGSSVVQFRDFFKLANDQLLVIADDFNLPCGRLRVRAKGSAGGQKGLDDIIRACGDDVPRLRIGIGAPPGRQDPADYVLGRFTSAERVDIELAIALAADAAEVWAREGIAACMNRFNGSEKDKP